MTPTLPSTHLPPPPAFDTPLAPVAEPELDDDGLPPLSADMLAALRELNWLDGELNAGRLDQYYGEYLFSLDHTIISHSVLMGPAWDEAEAYVNARGIPFERLAIYNIPSFEYPMRIE